MATTSETLTRTRTTPKSDPTARTEMPVEPAGEVERSEENESQDKSKRAVMPLHTEATVAPSDYVDRERIAALAYRYWLDREGREGGCAEEDWLRAEEAIRTRRVGS